MKNHMKEQAAIKEKAVNNFKEKFNEPAKAESADSGARFTELNIANTKTADAAFCDVTFNSDKRGFEQLQCVCGAHVVLFTNGKTHTLAKADALHLQKGYPEFITVKPNYGYTQA